MIQEITAIKKLFSAGAAMNIHLGFIPRHVVVWNTTAIGDTSERVRVEWFKDMPAGYGLTMTDAGALVYTSSACITAYAGTDALGDEAGFTLGALAGVNDTANEPLWIYARR